MKKHTTALAALVALGLAAAAPAAANDPPSGAAAAADGSAADNSGRNVRDRDGSSLTPTDQGTSEGDVALTQKIRQRVVQDDSLSMLAHNVKIITVDGVVTLRGPVKSAQEKQTIAAAAEQIAGRGKVKDGLEVAP